MITEKLSRIPAAIMIVPLIIGALVNTFAPWAIKIGGFTEALGSAGFATIVAAYMFCAAPTNVVLLIWAVVILAVL